MLHVKNATLEKSVQANVTGFFKPGQLTRENNLILIAYMPLAGCAQKKTSKTLYRAKLEVLTKEDH